MNKLRGLAAATGAEFEIYSRSVESKKIDIENSQLKDAQSAMSDGVSLRLLKDGMCGFSFTGDLKDPEALVNNALASLKSGVGEEFLFPGNKIFPRLKTFSEQAASVTSENLLEEAFRIAGGLRNRSLAQINASVKLSVIETRIFNSSGTDISWKESFVDKTGAIVSPGGAKYVAGESSFGLTRMSESLLEAVAGWSEADKTEIRPVPGKRNVLFMPSAMDALLSRIQSGCSGQSLHQNTTPLAGRIGEEVFSEKLTLRNNLLDDSFPGGRFADDEGVPCSDFVLFEKGVFRGFYFDLNYAAKAGSVSKIGRAHV